MIKSIGTYQIRDKLLMSTKSDACSTGDVWKVSERHQSWVTDECFRVVFMWKFDLIYCRQRKVSGYQTDIQKPKNRRWTAMQIAKQTLTKGQTMIYNTLHRTRKF